LITRYLVLLFVLLCVPNFASPSKKVRNSAHLSASHHKGKKRVAKTKKAGAWKRHGQQAIDQDRTRAIQEALIRERYLSGTADGVWNAATKAAMARYQHENGWQSKRVPDSRALIKLRLGPNHEVTSGNEVAGAPSNRNSGMAGTVTAPQR
jgi:peptidoglycan hydrolase-like protein with peptidoglycan-binding domain